MARTETTTVDDTVGGSFPSTRTRDYAELLKLVRQAGLMDRRHGYYTVKTVLTIGLFAAAWMVFALVGDSWWQLLTAVLLAVASAQLGFLGHDAGHRQIATGRRWNEWIGLVSGNLLTGISIGWWTGKHNRHHANPNHVERDPDVNLGPVAFTQDQARAKRGLQRGITRYQAYLLFPLLMLEAVQLHVSSVQAIVRGRVRRPAVEATLFAIHTVAYVTALLVVLSPVKALLFAVVHQALFGLYLGCSFAPNHKGMPVLSDEDELDPLRSQVLTARNIRGGRFTDFALGGLNYQIEHHLFPAMPRPNLRRSQPIVRRFCAERGVSYCETGLVESYAVVLRYMHTVGEPLRLTPVSVE